MDATGISIPLLLLFALAGYLLGIFSGLVPGIHSNNVALMFAALTPYLIEEGISPVYAAVAILANAISHTFHDIVPSIFLGVPDGDMALAVLPGHRLLLEGAGAEAVRLSALGSAGSVVASLFFILPLTLFFKLAYPVLEQHMGLILLMISFVMLASEKGEYVRGQGSLAVYRYKAYALFLFLLSGILGVFAFGQETLMKPLISFGAASALLPLLSGLFGSSQLIISLLTDSSIPEKSVSKMTLSRHRICRGILTGSAAGAFAAWLPGVSSSIATLVARIFIKEDFDKNNLRKKEKNKIKIPIFWKKNSNKKEKLSFWKQENADETSESSKEYIVSISCVNTANAIFGLIALLTIGKTRSGAMVAINEILDPKQFDTSLILLFFCVILLTSLLSYFSTISIGNNAHRLLRKINYSKLCIGVLLGLAAIVLLFTGLFGLFIFLISTPIGMLASFMNIRKSNAMGVIMVPVILYFL